MRNKGKDDAEKALRMERIIDEAFRLFSEKGIEAVTMPEIAEASGVARASLYRYFSTKVELVVAIGTRKWDEYIESYALRHMTPDRGRPTGAVLMARYLDSFIDLYHNEPDLLRFNYEFNSFMRHGRVGPEQRRPYTQMVERLRERFHAIYTLGTRDGTMRADMTEASMFSSSYHIMLAAATRFAVGLMYVPEDGDEPENELRMLRDLLLSRYRAADDDGYKATEWCRNYVKKMAAV